MQNKCKISVILPVYNAEKTIRRCVESVLAQSMPDFELLIIDDGSIDETPTIIDTYAKQDQRVRVFHKENSGVASARQLGIENAKGYYSIHVDADDWIEPPELSSLYKKAVSEDADLVICDYYRVIDNNVQYISQNIKDCNSLSLLNDVITDKVRTYLWSMLIKHSLYEKYNISFPLKMTYVEDTFVVAKLLLNNINVCYLPKAFYYYEVSANEFSLSKIAENSISKEGLNSLKYFIDFFEKNLYDNHVNISLDKRKVDYKKLLWNSRVGSKKLFVETYPEVNDYILQNYPFEGRPFPRSLLVALKYSYYLGRFIQFIGSIR